MKDLSQKPDYEMMWKVECELNKELQEQNKILKEALEFYETEEDWDFYCSCCADGSTKLEQDHGKRAREALAKVNE